LIDNLYEACIKIENNRLHQKKEQSLINKNEDLRGKE
jgi:hypothetical protein